MDKLLSKYEGLINRLSVKHSIPPNQIKEILEHYLTKLKEYLLDPRMPKIRIPFFGTFSPNIDSIRKSITMTIALYKKRGGDREKVLSKINKLYPVYRRLQVEKDKKWKRKTNSFWVRLKPKDYPENYKNLFYEKLEKEGQIYKDVYPSRK